MRGVCTTAPGASGCPAYFFKLPTISILAVKFAEPHQVCGAQQWHGRSISLLENVLHIAAQKLHESCRAQVLAERYNCARAGGRPAFTTNIESAREPLDSKRNRAPSLPDERDLQP